MSSTLGGRALNVLVPEQLNTTRGPDGEVRTSIKRRYRDSTGRDSSCRAALAHGDR